MIFRSSVFSGSGRTGVFFTLIFILVQLLAENEILISNFEILNNIK